mgnify:CR=1 FL=1
MGSYFDHFPQVPYQIDRNVDNTTNFTGATNVLARVKMLQQALDSVWAYYIHTVKDHETPEILAQRTYNDVGAYWIILLANNITDPQYDWPLAYDAFNKFIIDKYGSLATAKTTIRMWQKNFKSFDITTQTTTTNTTEITEDAYDTSVLPTSEGAPTSYTVGISVINIWEWKSIVYVYDWENDLNEAKRQIKLVKPDYLGQIQSEFRNLMRMGAPNPVLRRL